MFTRGFHNGSFRHLFNDGSAKVFQLGHFLFDIIRFDIDMNPAFMVNSSLIFSAIR